MTCATTKIRGLAALASRIGVFGGVILTLGAGPLGRLRAEDAPPAGVRQAYAQRQEAYRKQPQDVQAAWQFARACFDLADFATNHAQRAELAQQGIDACHAALARDPKSAAAHYYLGLDQGQLARTKTLGALRLVTEMEREFSTASQLDPHFDYAGPDRSLGLLYRDAPRFASIGSRSKARQHLKRALELAPNYPENRLNLVESELMWNQRKEAREQLKTLEESLPKAREEFSGPAWASSWTDWNSRVAAARKTLGEPPSLKSPRAS